MNKLQILFTAALFSAVAAQAQNNPLWLRYPAISPDGKTIAFSYQGDLFTVPAGGGLARQLTSDSFYDSHPVWSPDGTQLAFSSNRNGSFDVWLVNLAGEGAFTCLTSSSGAEYPMAFQDANHVLYTAHLMPSAESLLCPSRFNEVYSVSTQGGRSRTFSALDLCDVDIRTDGAVLYHDHKGVENQYRKHHVSAIARDIWMVKDGKHTKLTTFQGEDRTPRWSKDGQSFFYLSEKDGTFNVYKQGLDSAEPKQLTQFTQNPVRCLTVSDNDDLCFWQDGEIYMLRNGKPSKVKIRIKSQTPQNRVEALVKTDGATEIAVSPNGKEIAFVVRGEVYVTSVDNKTTRQITDTPEQERGISFSPDGKALVYASERNGLWQIYQTKIADDSESQFITASQLIEEQLIKSDQTSQQPHYSPDGTRVAYLENRGTLKVLDLNSKTQTTCLEGNYMYSVMDGDLGAWFEWSPDGKWFLTPYISNGGWHNQDIALVSASGDGQVYNLTQSGYNEMKAHWALGGKAMLFESDRDGDRPHGSWGSADDAYLMFFDLDAYNCFMQGEVISTTAPETLDLNNCRDRIVRLTSVSSHIWDMALSPDGNTLYYLTATQGEPGFWTFQGQRDLWAQNIKDKSFKMVQKGTPTTNMQASADGTSIFLCGSTIQQYDVATSTTKPVDFEATFNYRPFEERKYMFQHFWQQVQDKFYDPQLHGVDWGI